MGAKRTPFGTFGGVFRNTSATELQMYAFNAALKDANVAATQVDSVVVGQVMSVSMILFVENGTGRTSLIPHPCVVISGFLNYLYNINDSTYIITFDSQASQSDGTYTPRHAALKAGIPNERPVLGVNRLCGSGFQSIVNSAQVRQDGHLLNHLYIGHNF